MTSPQNCQLELLGFAFSLSRQGFADDERAALRAADDHARAAPPEVCGVRPVALRKIQRGEVVEVSADIRVVGAERLLVDRERALVERLGLGIAALGLIQHGEVVEVGADIRVVGAERLLAIASARLYSGSASA